MMLVPGRQLLDAHGAHYTVVDVRRESAGSVIYDAEKAFLNYRYREREFYRSGRDEQLPVLLRCPCYPDDDAPSAEAIREMLEFEATQVLTLPGGRWFPEPLDLVSLTNGTHGEVAAAPDPLAPRRSVLAMVLPHGAALHAWCDQGASVVARMQCAREALELLALLHGQGLLLCGFDPRDLLVDPDGRFYYLGTDRIVRESRMPRLRRFFPPERFFAPWSAPEALDAQGWLDSRSDFYTWAALAVWLIAYQPTSRSDGADPQEHHAPAFDPRAFEPARLRDALTRLARHAPSLLTRSSGPLTDDAVDRWMEAVRCCLEPDPQRRPDSAASLEEMLLGSRPDAPRRSRGWRRLFGR